MTTIKVAKGLRQTYKNAVTLTVEESLNALKKRTDCYEVLNDINRPYGDIDGKVLENCSEEEFNKVDNETKNILQDWLSREEYSLMTSSSFLHKKISYRFVFTKFSVSKEDNKEWIKQVNQEVLLPNGVRFDFGVYGKNQKMRMLGSNKDGENRPLILVRGNPIDTLISYIPEDVEALALPKKEKKEKKEKKGNTEPTIVSHILDLLSDARFEHYDDWLKIGMICYNEGIDVSVWDEYSKRSIKYKEGDCASKWKTFGKNSLTIATLWSWLKEDNIDGYNKLKQDDYDYKKKQFEETHFKLMNPAVYVRIYNGKINLLKHNELLHLYNNLYCNNELFITKWIKDPEIRTYEELVYKPKQEVPDNVFNIFTGFPNEPVEGNIAPIQEVLRLLSNNDQKVFDYIEKWVAWILQRPSQKTGVCIIVQGEQGIGKDTYFDFIGNLLGEYYFNTSRAEEDVFTHFDGHLKKVLLMKFEEASFLVNKKNETALKGWITCKDKSYTNKGFDPIKLDNYFNIVMTTNSEVPVVIEQTDRRFVLIKGSSEKRGHHQFWTEIHKQLNKPELLQAYLYYLLNIDLTGFNPRESRPITEYYEEVKQSFIPYHAQFFQHYICTHCDEDNDTQSFHFRANDLLERMKQSTSFDLNKTKLGRNLKIYPDAILHRDEKRYGTDYTITSGAKMREFLISQKWWVD
jgi:hypothetical protein